jgi:hypothetical protein
MSNQRVSKVTRKLSYISTFANGILTVTTSDLHYLAVDDKVEFISSISSGAPFVAHVETVTSTTVFTVVVSAEQAQRYLVGEIKVSVFRTGQTGRVISPLSRMTGAAIVLQSFVVGTGTAVYGLEASLDGIHWTPIATVTHAATSGDTQSAVITPNWAFIAINITSIGVATSLEVLYSA